jgi:hypothetical protein
MMSCAGSPRVTTAEPRPGYMIIQAMVLASVLLVDWIVNDPVPRAET